MALPYTVLQKIKIKSVSAAKRHKRLADNELQLSLYSIIIFTVRGLCLSAAEIKEADDRQRTDEEENNAV